METRTNVQLSDALLDVATALKMWQHGLVPADDISDLVRTVHHLCDVIDACASEATAVPYDVVHMVSEHNHVLSQLQRTLSFNPSLRSIQDRLFNRLQRIAGWRVVAPATQVFESFIKGITYFAHEHDARAKPVYHRLYSCGTASQEHRHGNLICSEGLTAAELRRRRPLIERCYIERLIYDQIYQHESITEQGTPANLSSFAAVSSAAAQHELGTSEGRPCASGVRIESRGNATAAQDQGHLFNMQRTKEDFETCFPNTIIEVEVTYHDNMPQRLIVQRTTARESVRLVYDKDYIPTRRAYSEVASCTKFMPDGSVWMKSSTFEAPGVFRQRPPSPRARSTMTAPP